MNPNVIHYSCMADVLGRAGLANEAWDLIKRMPLEPTASIWGSLLSSCRIHGDHKLARIAFEHLFEIETDSAATMFCFRMYMPQIRNGEKFQSQGSF